jgi:hypothetical protein
VPGAARPQPARDGDRAREGEHRSHLGDFTITIAGPRTITKSATEGLSAAPVKFQMLEILDPQDLKTGLKRDTQTDIVVRATG